MENNDKKIENTATKKKVEKKVTKNNIMDNRKIVYILLAVIVILLIVVVVLLTKNNSTSDGSRENTKVENGVEISDNKKILEERDLNGVKFTNISLTQDNGVGTISAELVNTTSENQKEFNLDIKFKDKDGNVILSLGDIVPALEPNQTHQFSSTVKFDFVNSYDMEVTRIDNEEKVVE